MELMNTRMFKWRMGQHGGLASHIDIIFININKIIYNKPLHEAKTIFIHTRLKHILITKFVNTMLDKLVHPVNIVIAGEDCTFPINIDARYRRDCISKDDLKKILEHKYINKIFVENLVEYLPKTQPIPLGLSRKECPVYVEYFKEFMKININKSLKITNFNRTRNGRGQWSERGYVSKLCVTIWKHFYEPHVLSRHEMYLNKMSQNMFTLCVHGGGIDPNPKLFEALLVGTIPIIRKNEPYTTLYHDMPVVIVDKWEDISLNNLIKWKNKYYNMFINNHDYIIERLSLEYYVKLISTI